MFGVSTLTPSLSLRERGTWLAAIVAKRQRWLDRTGSQSTHRLGLGALSLSLRERARVRVGVRRPMRPPSRATALRWQTTANRRAGADHAAFGSGPDCMVPAKVGRRLLPSRRPRVLARPAGAHARGANINTRWPGSDARPTRLVGRRLPPGRLVACENRGSHSGKPGGGRDRSGLPLSLAMLGGCFEAAWPEPAPYRWLLGARWSRDVLRVVELLPFRTTSGFDRGVFPASQRKMPRPWE